MAGSKNKDISEKVLGSASSKPETDFSADAIFATLTDMLSELLDMPKKDFSLDTMLFEELPLDSLQLYELVVDLETRYAIHISDEAIEMVQTIGDVVEMIRNAKK